MWIIKHVDTDECYYLLPSNEKYSVGRASSTDFDVVLRGDTSISRTHAFLYLQKTGTDCMLQLEDAGSKFGTFHNGVQVTASTKTPLQAGDRIRFGLLKNVWSVAHYPLVCITSALPPDQSQALQHYLSTVGATLLSQWDSTCTHLTMSEATVTVKVLHALLDQLPIVTCEYWRELSHAVRRRTSTLPTTAAYTPRCCESIINSDAVDLKANPARKTLFAGVTFVFMNRKHYDMYAGIVQKAGAKCRDLNSRGGVAKTFLIKSKVVVIQYVPSTQSQSTQTINSIEEYLESHNLRVVPEYEIGLAILHCSTEKYCNPSYKVLNDLIPSTMNAVADEIANTVLVKNTNLPNSLPESQVSDVLIPETQVNPNVPSRSQLQMLDDADDIQLIAVAKSVDVQSMTQIRVTESVKEQSQNAKRKHSNEIDVDIEDDEAENVFQSAKRSHLDVPKTNRSRTHKKVAEVVKRSATPPTTSEKAKQQKSRHTRNSNGFISKPAAAHEENELTETNEKQSNAITHKKRPHIALITEDDDDDDLFNFGNDKSSASVTKKSRHSDSNAKNDSDDELFSFGATQNRVDSVSGDEDDDGRNISEKHCDSSKRMEKPYQLPKPIQLPKKVSAEGWLSCALEKVKIETAENEENVPQNVSKNEESVNMPENCVQVHMFSFREKPSTQRDDSSVTHSAEASVSGKRNNFKCFVKRYHRPCANVSC